MEASKKVLVTGATGFVGRRLVKTLLQEGVKVRCMSRGAQAKFPPGVETVIGDLLDPSSLSAAFENIDTAYYLVHSLAKSRTNFAKYDHQAAENFVTAGEKTGLRRTIYLGGLGETGDRLSEHLAVERPSLSRELIHMKELGWIDFEQSRFTILDMEALEDELFR